MTYKYFAYKNKEGKWLTEDGKDRIGGSRWKFTDDIDRAYVGRPPRGLPHVELDRFGVKVTHFVRELKEGEQVC